VPEELAAITMKCIQKRAGDRFETMAELGDALRSYLRRRAAAVDEHALTALLERLCGRQKEQLRQRLRSYGGGGTPPARASQAGAVGEEVPISRFDAPPVVSTQGRTKSTKRWALAAGSAFAFLGALVLLFGLSTFRARRAPTPVPAVATTASKIMESAAPSARAVPPAPPPPASPAEPGTPPVGTAPATHAPRRGGKPVRGHPDAGAPGTSSAPQPASAPFRTLDPVPPPP
jgi:hypothetical protein